MERGVEYEAIERLMLAPDLHPLHIESQWKNRKQQTAHAFRRDAPVLLLALPGSYVGLAQLHAVRWRHQAEELAYGLACILGLVDGQARLIYEAPGAAAPGQ